MDNSDERTAQRSSAIYDRRGLGVVAAPAAWLAFETDRGLCYLDPEVIVGLGAPMWNKPRSHESRAIVLRNGGYQSVLNSEANIATIRSAGFTGVPADAHEQHAPVAVPKAKARKVLPEDDATTQPAKRGRKKAQP
jgi:hypothetical protein